MTHLSRPLLLISLCFVVVAAGCSGSVSVSGTTQGLQTNPSPKNSVEGNWAMISPASITLEIFQNGSSLTVLLNGSPCSGIMSPITLQGSVTEDSVTLSGSGITISATVSFGAPQTLSGTITCGVSTISFTATNIASVTGQWTGTFTALGPTNNGVQTSVDANLVETLNSNNFPTLTGSVSFGKLGSTESCLAAAGGGPITHGAILGTSVFIQATSTVNGQTVTIVGVADPTGHFINVASYSVGCGTSPLAGTEAGTGSLSRS
jgi:hypothetical protein